MEPVLLRIEFDYKENGFTIKNPPVLPREGEMISFRWADYIDDPARVEALINFEAQGGCFFANIASQIHSTEYTEIVVILIAREDYYQYIDDSGRERKDRAEKLRRVKLVH